MLHVVAPLPELPSAAAATRRLPPDLVAWSAVNLMLARISHREWVGRRGEAAFDGGDATSDAGALLLGTTDRAIGLVHRFGACFDDDRAQGQVEHSIETNVAQRVFGIALGYEDLVDHDQLRHEVRAGRCGGENCTPCPSQKMLVAARDQLGFIHIWTYARCEAYLDRRGLE
jgi:Transposase DDE domain group 1